VTQGKHGRGKVVGVAVVVVVVFVVAVVLLLFRHSKKRAETGNSGRGNFLRIVIVLSFERKDNN